MGGRMTSGGRLYGLPPRRFAPPTTLTSAAAAGTRSSAVSRSRAPAVADDCDAEPDVDDLLEEDDGGASSDSSLASCASSAAPKSVRTTVGTPSAATSLPAAGAELSFKRILSSLISRWARPAAAMCSRPAASCAATPTHPIVERTGSACTCCVSCAVSGSIEPRSCLRAAATASRLRMTCVA